MSIGLPAGSMPDEEKEPIIKVKDLKKHFPVKKGLFAGGGNMWVKAVNGISFAIREGESFGLVGESGCGKTTVAKLILHLEEPTAGSILFKGKDVVALRGKALKDYRADLSAVFQDPYSSLNPRMTIKSLLAEPVRVILKLPEDKALERVKSVLNDVGLRSEQMHLYPHEFSGGQRQRIALARALVTNPRLIVLDEPVSALDVSIQTQIMNLLKWLQKQRSLAYLFIAHNLGVMRYVSHRIGVMYLGRMAEIGDNENVFSHPLHPYTQALISVSSLFQSSTLIKKKLLAGEVPSLVNRPPGCLFHPRCPDARSLCSRDEPVLEEVSPEHWVACHFYKGNGSGAK